MLVAARSVCSVCPASLFRDWKSLGPRHAQAPKQVTLDKHGLETLESGKYQTREETQRTRASAIWYAVE